MTDAEQFEHLLATRALGMTPQQRHRLAARIAMEVAAQVRPRAPQRCSDKVTPAELVRMSERLQHRLLADGAATIAPRTAAERKAAQHDREITRRMRTVRNRMTAYQQTTEAQASPEGRRRRDKAIGRYVADLVTLYGEKGAIDLLRRDCAKLRQGGSLVLDRRFYS